MAKRARGRSRARTTSTGFVLVGLPPVRRTVGVSGRAPYSRQRQGSLTEEERSEILRLVGVRSLRDIAADLGVSHETVLRVVLRDADKVA